jgi:small conductance mechanosensitive channel
MLEFDWMSYVIKAIGVILVLWIGFMVIKAVCNRVEKLIKKRSLDPALEGFAMTIMRTGLRVLLILSVLGMVGVDTASFAAVIAAVSFAIGFALQGSLSNLAGGVMIMIFRPFTVNEFIQAAGHTGKVKEIQLFQTHLLSPDGKRIIIPNGELSNASVINFTREAMRRIDFVIGIDYGDDLLKAQGVVLDILKKDEKVLAEPAPFVGLLELGDSSVNLAVRPWVQTEDYWPTYFRLMERFKLDLDAAGIQFPYPHMDVTMLNQD